MKNVVSLLRQNDGYFALLTGERRVLLSCTQEDTNTLEMLQYRESHRKGCELPQQRGSSWADYFQQVSCFAGLLNHVILIQLFNQFLQILLPQVARNVAFSSQTKAFFR